VREVYSDSMVVGRLYSAWNDEESGSMEFIGLDEFKDPMFKNPTGTHLNFGLRDGVISMFSSVFYEIHVVEDEEGYCG
jgi:hypothetical protein